MSGISTYLSIDFASSNNEDSLCIESFEESLKLSFNVIYQTNTKQNLNFYLLQNYDLIPFSINNSELQAYHTLPIEPSSNIEVSLDNILTISNLKYRMNDFCLIVTSPAGIFTKRFQVNNPHLMQMPPIQAVTVHESDIKPFSRSINKACFVTSGSPDSESTLVKNTIQNPFNLCIDLYPQFENSRYQNDFNNNDCLEIPYIIILFSLDGEIINTYSLKTNEPMFYLSCCSPQLSQQEDAYFLVFPFPYTFMDSSEFLYSYKAVLWSQPLVSYEIERSSK